MTQMDPTYDRAVIDADPETKLAFEMSEWDNDNAPIGWSKYRALARFALAREAKLQAFKDFVHARLDEAGVPTHPGGPHSAAGCRIGDRLDFALSNDVLAIAHAHTQEGGLRVVSTYALPAERPRWGNPLDDFTHARQVPLPDKAPPRRETTEDTPA